MSEPAGAVDLVLAHPVRLTVTDVTVRFGGVVALDDVSLEVRPGQILGLIGPNGAGKTTMIDAITGYGRPDHGTIELNGTPIDRWLAHPLDRPADALP